MKTPKGTPPLILLSIALICTVLAVTVRADSDMVTQAKKRAADADAQLRQAKTAMVLEGKRLMKAAESTPQWQKGAAALKDAQARHEKAVKAARAALMADPAYKSALADRGRCQRQRDDLQSDPKATPEQRTQAAIALLKASGEVTKREQQALADDAQVTQAQSALDQAQYVMEQLKKAAALEAAKDPAFQAARQHVDSANTQVAQAQQQLQDARKQQARTDEQKLDQDIENKRNLIFNPNHR